MNKTTWWCGQGALFLILPVREAAFRVCDFLQKAFKKRLSASSEVAFFLSSLSQVGENY